MANHTTGAQRYNARMNKIWQEARALERERLARGEDPNPNLTDVTERDRPPELAADVPDYLRPLLR